MNERILIRDMRARWLGVAERHIPFPGQKRCERCEEPWPCTDNRAANLALARLDREERKLP
jgi:hypothetical protein